MAVWYTTVAEVFLRLAAKMFGRFLRKWLKKGMDKLDIKITGIHFSFLQTENPFIEAEIEFTNMSIFRMIVDRQVKGEAKLVTISNGILLPVLSSLDLLKIDPSKKRQDLVKIFMPTNVAQKIIKYADVGQESRWLFYFKWRLVVNGQVLPLERIIPFAQIPKLLVF